MSFTYYQAYLHGYLAGEVDQECSAPEGNGLTSYTGNEDINLDAWDEAQRWGYQDGIDGNPRKSEKAVEGHLDNEYSI